jgi:hypothetical protein
MSRILLQTTIADDPNDWHVGRFSLLASVLRAAGHQVVARNRLGDDDPVLSHVDQLGYHQLWLLAVDVGEGLTDDEAAAILRLRDEGGGLLTARDHQDLGSCLRKLGSVGQVNRFHDEDVDPATMCDDQDTPAISWPNFHSGANGDFQEIEIVGPPHPVLADPDSPTGAIRYLPSHPHEGGVGAPEGEDARIIVRGKSIATGTPFNIAVAFEPGAHGGPGIAESTFHHFADYNWDPSSSCPSFVSEPPGDGLKRVPQALADTHRYVLNIAAWLTGVLPTSLHSAAMRPELVQE